MNALGTGLALCLALASPPETQVRGAWIEATDLTRLATRREVSGAMERLSEAGILAVFPPASTAGSAGERDLLAEILFEAHRRGIEVLPWLEVRATEADLVEAAVETCRERDLDGLVVPSHWARIRKELATLEPGLVAIAPAGVQVPEADAVFQLPMTSKKAPEKPGHVVLAFGRLLEEDGKLAEGLGSGPFYEEATLPWRTTGPRRIPAEPIEAFAGGGLWTWMTLEGEPRFLAMDGGDVGHATWSFEPAETGEYALYARIPARADLADRASYQIASAGNRRTIGVDTSGGKNRGWVYLGVTRLEAHQRIEVARLDAEEQDATRITAAGPLVALRSHRVKPR
jgi:hypothetical protein